MSSNIRNVKSQSKNVLVQYVCHYCLFLMRPVILVRSPVSNTFEFCLSGMLVNYNYLTPDEVLLHLMWKEREQEVAKKLLPAIELNPPKPLVTQPRASLNLEKVRASAGEGFEKDTLHQGHFYRKVKTLVNGNSVLGPRPVSTFCLLGVRFQAGSQIVNRGPEV